MYVVIIEDMGGGDKRVDECRRVPAPFIASQPNVLMEGKLCKQTNNRNWPVRFAFLTTGLFFFHYLDFSCIIVYMII